MKSSIFTYKSLSCSSENTVLFDFNKSITERKKNKHADARIFEVCESYKGRTFAQWQIPKREVGGGGGGAAKLSQYFLIMYETI